MLLLLVSLIGFEYHLSGISLLHNPPALFAADSSPGMSCGLHWVAVSFHCYWAVSHLLVASNTWAWRWHIQQSGLWGHHTTGAVCLGTCTWISATLEERESLATDVLVVFGLSIVYSHTVLGHLHMWLCQ